MDQDESAAVLEVATSSNSCPGRTRRIRAQTQRGRKRAWVDSGDGKINDCNPQNIFEFPGKDKWSVTELTRLLEALKRYEPHKLKNIALLIGSKTEKEIENKIRSLQQSDAVTHKAEKVGDPSRENAPIEGWIDLVQDMTNYEPADYTQFIPQILGYITRNERFAESGHTRLKWSNIYQFLTDILMDRVEVQQLTDVESMVVLDLMQSLGDTLHTTDTTEQRRILDFKYNLLNFKADNPRKMERELINLRIHQALSNDFWDPEDMPGPVTAMAATPTSSTGTTPASTSSTGTTPTATSSAEVTVPAKTSSNSSTPTASSSRYIHNSMAMPTSSDKTQTDTNPLSASTPDTARSVTSPKVKTSEGKAQVLHLNDKDRLNSKSAWSVSKVMNKKTEGSCSVQPEDQAAERISGNNTGDLAQGKASTKFKTSLSIRERNAGIRPKFLTLNPLCIATQHLPFQPKSCQRSSEAE